MIIARAEVVVYVRRHIYAVTYSIALVVRAVSWRVPRLHFEYRLLENLCRQGTIEGVCRASKNVPCSEGASLPYSSTGHRSLGYRIHRLKLDAGEAVSQIRLAVCAFHCVPE